MFDAVNPYIAGSPVTSPTMFFGRQDVFTFVHQTLIGRHRDNVIVLYGQRRTGKTSVLYQMRNHLDSRYLCVFTDMHGFAIESLDGFLWELANHIIRVLLRDYHIDLARPDKAEFLSDPRHYFANEFLSQIFQVIGDRHILLMIDEAIRLQEQVQAGKLEQETFLYMRHLMQHYERLDFLFSLGSGLEILEKNYSFLFSVGLYKKISFLERDAAVTLMTQPVKDCYEIEPAAIERILHVTSGHPYYTQLLCHCLFNYCQRRNISRVTVKDVNEILDETVERGLAVLKHVWEESTPNQRAVLAALAAAKSTNNPSVDNYTLGQIWASNGVTIPRGEITNATRDLLSREIVTGHEKYMFTVDLQRMWVQKYKRLEWVKEEIIDTVQNWSSHNKAVSLSLSPSQVFGLIRNSKRLLIVLIVVVIIATSLAVYRFSASPNSIYPVPSGANLKSLMNDSLSQQQESKSWHTYTDDDTSACEFKEGALHVVENRPPYHADCIYADKNFGDFAFEVQMKILKGDCGGIIFRADTTQPNYYYYFRICQNEQYYLNSAVANRIDQTPLLSGGSIKSIYKVNQINSIEVSAIGSNISLFVNDQFIYPKITDSSYSHGYIAVVASAISQQTEVEYSNAKVWASE